MSWCLTRRPCGPARPARAVPSRARGPTACPFRTRRFRAGFGGRGSVAWGSSQAILANELGCKFIAQVLQRLAEPHIECPAGILGLQEFLDFGVRPAPLVQVLGDGIPEDVGRPIVGIHWPLGIVAPAILAVQLANLVADIVVVGLGGVAKDEKYVGHVTPPPCAERCRHQRWCIRRACRPQSRLFRSGWPRRSPA